MMDDELDPLQIQQLLQARADALAQNPETVLTEQGSGLVVVKLGQEQYGVPIEHVQEIRPMGQVTRVPGTPSFYAGLTNLRGHLYPVLHLARYLDVSQAAPDASAKLILVSAGNLEIGLLADQVIGIRWLDASHIQPLLADASNPQRSLIAGVTEDLLSILDIDALIADSKLVVQDQVI